MEVAVGWIWTTQPLWYHGGVAKLNPGTRDGKVSYGTNEINTVEADTRECGATRWGQGGPAPQRDANAVDEEKEGEDEGNATLLFSELIQRCALWNRKTLQMW